MSPALALQWARCVCTDVEGRMVELRSVVEYNRVLAWRAKCASDHSEHVKRADEITAYRTKVSDIVPILEGKLARWRYAGMNEWADGIELALAWLTGKVQ